MSALVEDVVMKTHSKRTENGTIEWYFDPAYGWVVVRIPINGEATHDYVGHKSALAHGIQFADYMLAQEASK